MWIKFRDAPENRVYKFLSGGYKREGVMKSTAKLIHSKALSRFPHPCIFINISVTELTESRIATAKFRSARDYLLPS